MGPPIPVGPRQPVLTVEPHSPGVEEAVKDIKESLKQANSAVKATPELQTEEAGLLAYRIMQKAVKELEECLTQANGAVGATPDLRKKVQHHLRVLSVAFNQEHQQVQTQYNAGRDIIFNTDTDLGAKVNNLQKSLDTMQSIRQGTDNGARIDQIEQTMQYVQKSLKHDIVPELKMQVLEELQARTGAALSAIEREPQPTVSFLTEILTPVHLAWKIFKFVVHWGPDESTCR